MDISGQKKAARAQAYARRSALREGGSGSDARASLHAVAFAQGAVVSAYLPIRTEISPLAAMQGLHALGKRICVPVIQGAGLPLRFREWLPGCALEPGPFGAEVPVAGDWLQPDLLLVPLLAFDARLYRLGYGGGFYDRTIAAMRAERLVVAAGFAFAGQRVDAVPVSEFDQKLDAVITEDGIFRD